MSAVNTHVLTSERLDVTPSQAVFATPRGYTQDGDADSGHAAPNLDPVASTLRNYNQAGSTATEELRRCEGLLDEPSTTIPSVRRINNSLKLPPFSVYIWDLDKRRRIEVKPMNVSHVSQ
jgi:hypothetical protein